MKNLRTLLYMLTLLLSVVGIQPAEAQEPAVQDALYIYRNDGGFHGFFYGEIERFDYSCIDTLGVEHEDYVVQEVVTVDSIYRIPISAIDSIGFVTPETVYKKDVVHTTKSELWNYVIGSDSFTVVRFASSTPAALIPKVGDKIVTTDSREYLPGGFYGRVTGVDNTTQGIEVVCETPELTELFDTWVCKAATEGISIPATDRASTRFSEESYKDEWDLPYFGKDIDLTDLSGISYSLDDNWAIEGSGRLKYGIANHIYISVFGMLRSTLGINFDLTARIESTAEFDLSVKGKCAGSFDFTFTPGGKPIKKWIPKSPCFVEFEVGWSMGLSGETELKFLRKYTTGNFFAAQYNDNFYESGGGSVNTHSHSYPPISETSLTGNLEGTFGFYTSLGVSLIDKKIAYLGARADLGARAKVNADIAMTDFLLPVLPAVLPTYLISSPTALYDALNRDGSVSFGPFFKSQGELSVGKFKKPFLEYDNKADTTFVGALVPMFSKIKLETEDGIPSSVSVDISRKTLLNPPVGFSMYYTKSGKRLGETWWKTQSFNPDKLDNYSMDLPKFGGGKEVRIFPVVKLLKLYEILGSPYESYTVPAKLECVPEELTFEAEGGEEKLTISDNLDRSEDKYTDKYGVNIEGDEKEKWLTVQKEGDAYKVVAKPNIGTEERTGTVDFYIYNEDRSIDLMLNVPVTQKAPEITFSVSPEELEVPGYSKEFKNGELTQQMTIVYPNTTKSLKVTSSDESWLTVDNNWVSTKADELNTTGVRTLHIKPNFNLETPRDGTITVEMTAEDGYTATRTLKVKQSAFELNVEFDPTDVTLTAEEKKNAAYSHKVQVGIKMELTDSYVKAAIKGQEVKTSTDWLEAVVKDDVIEVRAKANPNEADRKATITYTVEMKDGGRLTKTINVTQLAKQVIMAFTFSPEVVRLPVKGGEKQVFVVGDDVDHIFEIDCMSSKWLGGAASGLSITLSAQPNNQKEERVTTVYITCIMKDGTKEREYFLVYQDGTESSQTPDPVDDAFNIHQVMLNSAFNLRCTNASGYKEKPYNEWEPTNRTIMGFNCDKGDTDKSATLTMIDRNNLHLECIEHHEYIDSYTKVVAKTDEVFSADITKIREEDEDEDVIIHLKISNVKHVRDYTEQLDDIKYTEHCEYAVSPGATFYTVGYPAIYDYDGKLQYRGKLMWSGGASSWGEGLSTMEYYEEYSFDNGERKQKYEYVTDLVKENGITLQIEFEPNSMWDSWLEGEQVDDFGYNTRK